MKNIDNESIQLYTLVSLSVIVFICLAGFIVYFIILYQNRQLKNKQEQAELQANFRQEMLQAQLEIQEQTFTHVSREIHDNITQVLSFVKLNLGLVRSPEVAAEIGESRELIAQVINDLRDLSKSLSLDHIEKLGLLKTMEFEAQRINKSGIIKAEIFIEGEQYSLGGQREIVLFRIFQEALNNTLKYSGAKHFKIGLQYNPELFNLTLDDDGSGFSAASITDKKGAGLKNMENRAVLIGASATINSSPGNGCSIKVSLNPFEQRLYPDAKNTDRFS